MSYRTVGFLMVFVGCIFMPMVTVVAGGAKKHAPTPFPNDDRTRKIFEQERLLREGGGLVEQGRYDEAIAKYQAAMKAELLLHDYDVDRPILLSAKVLMVQGKYEEALEQVVGVLNKRPNAQASLQRDEKLEIEALIKARDTRSPAPLYQHIQQLKKKYFSPKGYRGDADSVFPTLVRLYEHIGDFDQGIAFVDEIRAYGLRQHKKVLSVSTSREALEQFQDLRKKRKGEWLEYKFAYEYLKIREAFEQDKAEGFKGCIDAKPGEACMGRATKALIQSDYFPW